MPLWQVMGEISSCSTVSLRTAAPLKIARQHEAEYSWLRQQTVEEVMAGIHELLQLVPVPEMFGFLAAAWRLLLSPSADLISEVGGHRRLVMVSNGVHVTWD